MNHGIGITQGLVSLPLVNIDYEGNVRSVIQCDLVINNGNSGGALLDKNEKVASWQNDKVASWLFYNIRKR